MATEEEKRLKTAIKLKKALEDLAKQASDTKRVLDAALNIEDVTSADKISAVTEAIQVQVAAYRTSFKALQDLKELEAAAEAARLASTSVAEHDAALAHLTEVTAERTLAELEANKTALLYTDTINKSAKAQEIYAAINAKVLAGIRVGAEEWANARRELDEYTESTESGALAADAMLDSMLGLSGGLQKVMGFLEKGPEHWKAYGTRLLENVKSGKALAQALTKLVKVSFAFAMEQDKIVSEFRKSTGAGEEFGRVIKDIEREGRIAGVTLDEAAQATAALRDRFSDFAYMSNDARENIGNTVSILGEMGFSMETQADIVQTATQSMGLGIGEAQTLLLDLASTAQSLDIDMEKLGAQFEANKDILVIFGSRAGEVFKEVATLAKAVGTDVGTMLGTMEQFKKFDTAAQSVGRLNAIMGRPALNAIDMLNAAYEDPARGLKMIKDEFDSTYDSVEALTGAELAVWADALGMGAADAAAYLGKTNTELELQTMNQEEAAAAAAKMQSITDKLTNSFKQFYLNAEPLVTNVIIPFADFVNKIAGGMAALGRGMESWGPRWSAFGNTLLFVGAALAAIVLMIPGLQLFGAAGLTALGVAAGLGGLTALGATGGGPAGGGGPTDEQLVGMQSGGRVLAEYAPRQLRVGSFAGGGPVVDTVAQALGTTPENAAALLGGEGSTAGSPAIPIRMNEANRKEMAIVPSGTMIANASDTKNVIKSNEAMVAEIRGLRQDLAAASRNNNGGGKVKLVLDNGREFSTTVVREGLRGDVLSPF